MTNIPDTQSDQMSFSLSGAFCPTSFPLFHGILAGEAVKDVHTNDRSLESWQV